ncbi:hypothetical protein [Bacillus cereus]|uniref:hypothetical protein n=1 Tax=Bacillus cereus group TaxID=86661 RepID=UPI000279DDEB|nr:hypothetical protein [Bacillus cereus]EJR72851.1 hypothetical protein IK9_05626 [Bacillus cereus VD166]
MKKIVIALITLSCFFIINNTDSKFEHIQELKNKDNTLSLYMIEQPGGGGH